MPGGSGLVDGIWLIKTATAISTDKHLHEGGTKIKTNIPLLCALLKKGNEYVLIDTGINHHFAFKPEVYLGGFKYRIAKLFQNMPLMEPGQDVVAQLARMGIEPEGIGNIILTHAHVDHTGELRAFPKAKIYIGPGETKFIQRAFGEVRGVMTRDFPWNQIKELSFADSQPILNFTGSFDLFGDGSVVIVPTPGHTPGSISVLVRTSVRPFLFVGDAAYTQKNIDRSINTGYNEVRELSLETIRRLHQLRLVHPEITMVTFHDLSYSNLPTNTPVSIFGNAENK